MNSVEASVYLLYMLANSFQKVSRRPTKHKCCRAPLTDFQRCKLQIRYYILIGNEIMTKLLEKVHFANLSKI